MPLAQEPDVENQQDALLPRSSLNDQPRSSTDDSIPLVLGGAPPRRRHCAPLLCQSIWILVAIVLVLVLVALFVFSPGDGPKTAPLRGWGTANATRTGQIRAGRKPLYNDPFNPDDLTFTEEECDAYFPSL